MASYLDPTTCHEVGTDAPPSGIEELATRSTSHSPNIALPPVEPPPITELSTAPYVLQTTAETKCHHDSKLTRPRELVLLLGSRQNYTAEKEEKYGHSYEFYPVDTRNMPDDPFLLKSLFEFISRCNVTRAFTESDRGALLLVVLRLKFPKIRGPSLLSSFICWNKFYTHKLLDPDPIPHCFVDLRPQRSIEAQEMHSILTVTELPVFVKPTTADGGENCSVCHSEDELRDVIQHLRNNNAKRKKYIDMFVNRFLDASQFSSHVSSGVLVMSLIDSLVTVAVQGHVTQGNVRLWMINERRMWPGCPLRAQMIIHPPLLLGPDLLTKISDRSLQIVGKLVTDYGFDDQFFEVECIVTKQNEIKLMEVNGRGAFSYNKLSLSCFSNGDMYKAALLIASGQQPSEPKLKGGSYHAMCPIRTVKAGRIGDMMNCEALYELGIEIDENEIVEEQQNSLTSKLVGYVVIQGDDYDELLIKLRSVVNAVYKDAESVTKLLFGK